MGSRSPPAPVPRLSLGFEAALEVPLHALDALSDEAIASSWMPQLLWAATDWMVVQRFDLKSTLCQLGVLTLATPPVAGLEHLIASNGAMGLLAGIPFAGDVLESQSCSRRAWRIRAVRYGSSRSSC